MTRNLTKTWILLIGVMFSLSCFGQPETISESDLIGCWTDSREENIVGSDLSVYRPCDFTTFPDSRYRYSLKLKTNKKCSWLYLSPTDAHHMVDGTWTFGEEDGWLEIFDLDRKSVNRFRVSSLGRDIMKIENK